MKCADLTSLTLLVFALLAAACAPIAPTPPPAIPTMPAPVSSSTPTAAPTAIPLSFTPATYEAEAQGFALDYPSDWTAEPISVVGTRGSSGRLLSPGATAEILPEGGTRVGITVYQWDPQNDLTAYAEQRQAAWDSGGYRIVKESSGDLVDGRKYMSFVVQAPDNAQAFFLLTIFGEDYLEVSGEGDLALVEEIAHTTRPLGFKQ